MDIHIARRYIGLSSTGKSLSESCWGIGMSTGRCCGRIGRGWSCGDWPWGDVPHVGVSSLHQKGEAPCKRLRAHLATPPVHGESFSWPKRSEERRVGKE